MDDLPGTWTALCVLALTLGARHGLDADHLATIDGLTRFNSRDRPGLARLCGALFSLGHGLVVCAVAGAAASLSVRWAAPRWLELTGVATSIAFLFGLAFLNIHAVLRTEPGRVVGPVGIRSRLLGRFASAQNAWSVAAVGALFALSFDTISQAIFFAWTAGRFGGVAEALFAAGLFTIGMLTVDAINGVWISRRINRAHRAAAIASRIMALTVSGVSLAIGLLTLAKLTIPAVDTWTEGRDLFLGGAVLAVVAAAFCVGMRSARRRVGTVSIPARTWFSADAVR
jgi:high-affinity nickel-transport protein